MILASVMLLAAEIPEYGGGECDARSVQYLVGRTATKARIAIAKRRSKANQMRKMLYGTIVTQEYMSGRLNILTNKRNVIVRIHCG
jgi:hypothetical protein